MAYPDYFTEGTKAALLQRINQLSSDSQPVWGKMSAAQMLAHCAVTYEMVYTNKHAKPNGLARFFLKLFIKPVVTGEKPYQKSSRTAPAFLISEPKVFETEKQKLMDYITRSCNDGRAFFEGKESNSFGALTANEWNIMFYKHLDHHLSQFGV